MRTAEKWGRVAVSLPGWRWMPGMVDIGQSLRVVAPQLATCTGRYRCEVHPSDSGTADGWCRAWVINYDPDIEDEMCDKVPDPDDPATEGCMVRLLGPVHEAVWYTGDCDRWVVAVGEERRLYTSLGRACIAAAQALGRWPGGAE